MITIEQIDDRRACNSCEKTTENSDIYYINCISDVYKVYSSLTLCKDCASELILNLNDMVNKKNTTNEEI